MELNRAFWGGQQVLVTGDTGFKGAWLAVWLERLGATVHGLSLPAQANSLWSSLRKPPGRTVQVDIRAAAAVRDAVAEVQPDIVFHLAAQSLVRRGYAEPTLTFETNVQGTLHVLDAVAACGTVRAVVVATSDKVYENNGGGRPFLETDPLGGHDPYSASKAAAELAVRSWRAACPVVPIATVRAGNVIGGGDVAADRLVPDAMRAIGDRRPLRLRHPEAIRPWQFVLEPLLGYLLVSQMLAERPENMPPAFNFGPHQEGAPVADVVDALFDAWGEGSWEVDGGAHPAEAGPLHVDSALARNVLGWQPTLALDEALDLVVRWYRAELDGADMDAVTLDQIAWFEQRVNNGPGR